MDITKIIDIEFADGTFETIFTLTRQVSKDRSDSRYLLDAVTSTGFNLTMSSYGVLKHCFDANRRLRSENSILAEMTALLNDIIAYASTNLKREIIKTLTIKKVLDNSEMQWFKGISQPFPTCSIKSIESGNSIAWYHHDVFNTESEIEVVFSRKPCGQLTAHASEVSLYDLSKLQALADSDSFINEKYAFFFYNEVKRLLGQHVEGSSTAMSGLFAKGAI